MPSFSHEDMNLRESSSVDALKTIQKFQHRCSCRQRRFLLNPMASIWNKNYIAKVFDYSTHRRNQLLLSGATNHKIFFACNK